MTINRVLFAATAATASIFIRSSAAPPGAGLSGWQATPQEQATFECARSLGGMLVTSDQSGPMFYGYDLAFTSITASNGSHILIAANTMGLFEFPLPSSGLNRIKFTLPVGERQTQVYYLGYMHGTGISSSRVFDFSAGVPPAGKIDEHFKRAVGTRAPRLLPHFNFALYETAGGMVNALIDGKLPRHAVRRDFVQKCDTFTAVNRHLNRIEMLVMGPKTEVTSSRMPASVGH